MRRLPSNEQKEATLSYRSDLDAAVARGDALAHEVKRLTGENEELRARRPAAPPRRSNVARTLAAMSGLGLALVGGIVLGVGTGRGDAAGHSAAEPAAIEPSLGVGTGGGDAAGSAATEPSLPTTAALAACADAIAVPPMSGLNRRVRIEELERTGAACRAELRAAASAGDRTSVAWADAEDVLSNRISLMGEHYKGDPAVLDRGGDGPQLWREYTEALATRDAVLAHWRASH
jgi:hypothetical protein